VVVDIATNTFFVNLKYLACKRRDRILRLFKNRS
jgi:hypothetical protein